MLHESTRKRWASQIAEEYPHIHPDMIETILDVYSSDREWMEMQIKALKKKNKGKLENTQMTADQFERIHENEKKRQEELQARFESGVRISSTF